MTELLLLAAALAVAFSNGANDNFKGFATVWGAQALPYRTALILATAATLAGCLASLWLAETLVQQFSGRGLVPQQVAAAPKFILSVAVGAALTVFLATRAGLPVSTTHALIGGLVGAGLGQSGGEVHWARLADSFLAPLLVSPLAAAGLGLVAYRLLRLRRVQDDCACVVVAPAVTVSPGGVATLQRTGATLLIAPPAQCDRVPATAARFSIAGLADRVHTLSAASICFARGVNDTPKLAALLVAAQLVDAAWSVTLIAGVMALGGVLYARRVAVTMSQRMTRLDATQGLAANLISAALVLLASKLGMPVSTTHVAVGAIAGVGVGARTIDWPTVRQVALSWIATLPLATALAWGAATFVR